MLTSKQLLWNACSPDSIALPRSSMDGPEDVDWVQYAAVCVAGRPYPIATVAVNNMVSRRSLDPHLLQVNKDMQMMHLCSPSISSYVPFHTRI